VDGENQRSVKRKLRPVLDYKQQTKDIQVTKKRMEKRSDEERPVGIKSAAKRKFVSTNCSGGPQVNEDGRKQVAPQPNTPKGKAGGLAAAFQLDCCMGKDWEVR